MNDKRGRFITVEGVEGVGKSTQIEGIKSLLDNNHIDYITTREPGGTPFAEEIRELLLTVSEEDIDPVSELLLIFAARAQHLSRKIIPALESGKWVLCDRFTDATYAYQGSGRQLGYQAVAELESFVQGDLRPDLTVILDLDPATGLERAVQRGSLDRFEREQLEFFERVRQAYLDRAAQDPSRYLVIDSSAAIENVREKLLWAFAERLGLDGP